MKTQTKTMASVLAAFAIGAAAASTFADEPSASRGEAAAPPAAATQGLVKDAEATVSTFRQSDFGLSRFFSSAVGYAVFPSVDKGAAGIGGAYGTGVLFERGHPSGRTTLVQVTVGPQLGGQAYSEIVFFESQAALERFKRGELAMAAQVSAVLANTGASANARYARGVAVFTLAKVGLMAEASVGGQRFAYRPFARAL